MIKILLNLIVLVLPFSELLRFEISPDIYLRILDVLVLILLILLIGRARQQLTQYASVWLFLGILIISNLNQPFNLQAAAYLGRTLIYFCLLPYFINPNSKILPKNSRLFNFSLLLFVLAGLLQYLWYPELRNLYYLGYDPHSYRWFGLFLDPNISSLILVWIIFYFWEQKIKIAKPLIALSFISLLLTYSRAGWLSFLAALVYKNYQKKSVKTLLFYLGFLLLGILMLPRYFGEGTNLLRTNSVMAKIESSQIVWSKIKAKPILGIGFNNIHLIKNSQNEPIANNSLYGIDNSWLTILITSGILGLGALLKLVKDVWDKSTKEMKILAIAYLVHSFSVNSFFIPSVFIFFLFFNLNQHK